MKLLTDDRLNLLRKRTIETFFKLFGLVLVVIMTLRLFQANYLHAGISLGLFLTMLAFFYYNKKEYKRYSIHSFCFITTAILGFMALFGTESETFSTSVLVLHMVSFMLVLPNPKLVLLHAISCVGIIILSLIKTGMPFMEYAPFILVICSFGFVFKFFVEFLEEQDRALELALTTSEASAQKLKKLNTDLVNSNEELRTYNQILSHDLKAPIRTISSFSALLKTNVTFNEEKYAEYFHFIEKSAKRMDNLVNDLLVFHNLDNREYRKQSVSVKKEASRIIDNYLMGRPENEVRVTIESIPEIHANEALVSIVLDNLISNAIKYQPKVEDHTPEIKISARKDSEFTEIIFEDNGIGIEREYEKNLFTPFKRFHNVYEYEGSGLGLSICKRVMKKTGGHIEYVRTNTKGATFKIKFPNHQPQ